MYMSHANQHQHHDPHHPISHAPPPPPPPPPPPLTIARVSSTTQPPPLSAAPNGNTVVQQPPQQGQPPQGQPQPQQQQPQNYPTPRGQSCRNDGRIYSLEVKQQPIRARMCGFGDKDRRPITPPPCVRLVVRDEATGKEVDINEVETSFYVLTVDLWSADSTREVNLVRHSATSPSISAATSSSYPPPPPTPPPHPHSHSQHAPHSQGLTPYQTQQPPYPGYVPAQPPLAPPQPGYYPPHQGGPTGYYNPGMHPPPPAAQPPTQQAPSGMFTRNLIGSLSASAFKLTDPDNKIGVWFILQDLSVRTEGSFRLKMNFVNVGGPDGQGLNTGVAPVLATEFSDVFQVYSAKKFPGVIESTGLSKCFATQGIKIPIRRDKGDGPEM